MGCIHEIGLRPYPTIFRPVGAVDKELKVQSSRFKVQEPRRGDITKDRVGTLSERHIIRYFALTGRWGGVHT